MAVTKSRLRSSAALLFRKAAFGANQQCEMFLFDPSQHRQRVLSGIALVADR